MNKYTDFGFTLVRIAHSAFDEGQPVTYLATREGTVIRALDMNVSVDREILHELEKEERHARSVKK